MRFVNLSGRPLKFDLAGVVYECADACEVDIPEKVAFCVKLHGIPLTPAADVEPVKAAPVAEPAPAVEPMVEPEFKPGKKNK